MDVRADVLQSPPGSMLFRGEDNSLMARVMPNEIKLRGVQAACSNCHGALGYGHRLDPQQLGPDITFDTLVAETATRPGYSYDLFVRALGQGLRSDGAALSTAMPRYELAQDKMRALYTFLQLTQEDEHRGIARDQIRLLQLVLPSQIDNATTFSEAFRSEWSKLLPSDTIFGRRITLETWTVGSVPAPLTAFAIIGSVASQDRLPDNLQSAPRVLPLTHQPAVEQGQRAARLIHDALLASGRDGLSRSLFMQNLRRATTTADR